MREMWKKDAVSDEDLSKFNTGIAIAIRVDALHRYLHEARVTMNYKSYRDMLECLFIELSRFLKEPEFKECSDQMDKVNKDFRVIYNNRKQGVPTPASCRNSFIQLELMLTRYEQKYNLGMPKGFDATYALAR